MKFTEIKLLLEYDRAKTAQNFGDKLLAVAAKDPTVPADSRQELRNPQMSPENRQNILDYLLSQFEAADPTTNKKYVQGIAKMYTNGQSALEDIITTMSDYLRQFDEMNRKKKIPVPRNDFNRYQNLQDFYAVVDEYWPEYQKSQQTKTQGVQIRKPIYPDAEFEIIYGEMDPQARILSDFIVVRTDNANANEWWAKHYPEDVTNRWCTAYREDEGRGYFNTYNRQGPLYQIIPRDRNDPREKYQFHFPSNQFMDWEDHGIRNNGGLAKLVERFPALRDVFQAEGERRTIPELMSQEFIDLIHSIRGEAEPAINNLLVDKADAIARKGLSELREYGLNLPPEIEQQVEAATPEYMADVVKELSRKGGFWDQVQGTIGNERSQEKIENILSRDQELKKIIQDSRAAKLITDELENNPDSRGRWDWHRDAASHVVDMGIADALLRLLMKQVPAFYNRKLAETGREV